MKLLYAPWRSIYARSLNEKKQPSTSADDCVFCTQNAAHDDDTHFIIKRYQYCFVALNKYPYNAGHLLVLPQSHHSDLAQLNSAARSEMIELITQSSQVVQRILQCDGVNIGFNIGKAAGAGIPSHLHAHVLPRWQGDTNFLPTLADTKMISFDLKEIYAQLKPAFKSLSI